MIEKLEQQCFVCKRKMGEPSPIDGLPIEAMYKLPDFIQEGLELETPYFCSLGSNIECCNIGLLGHIDLVQEDEA